MAAETLDGIVDELYGLPLDEFTRARDAVARELRKSGRRDDAEAVKRLRKPSLAAWVVNRLARERSEEGRRLLAAADEARRAPDAAAAELRSALDALVRGARDVLEHEGRPAGDATLTRVASTLRAAAADEAQRDALALGVLADELEPPGFEAMLGFVATPQAAPTSAPPRPPREAADAERKRRIAAAREELADARAHARDLRRAADEAERLARQARSEAERADESVEQAERRLAEARGR